MPTPEDFKKLNNDKDITIQNLIKTIEEIHMSRYIYDEEERCFVAPFKFEKTLEVDYIETFEKYYAKKFNWKKVSIQGIKDHDQYNYVILLYNELNAE